MRAPINRGRNMIVQHLVRVTGPVSSMLWPKKIPKMNSRMQYPEECKFQHPVPNFLASRISIVLTWGSKNLPFKGSDPLIKGS